MRGSIRKKGNSYYIRYYKDGKRVERFGGKTKDEAERNLNEVIYNINNGVVISSEMPLRDYMSMWLNDYVKDLKSDNTLEKYENVTNKYITPEIGDIKLNDLKVLHIEKFLRGLRKSKEKLSSTSIQTYYGVLRAALNKAVKLQLLNTNPCQYVDTPKRNKFKANVLTVEEFTIIYAKLNAESYEDYIMRLGLDIAIETGFRRGEMCGLCWEDINFKDKTISLNRALIRVRNKYEIGDLKTESSYRELPISESLCKKLERHKALQKIKKIGYGDNYIKNYFGAKKEYDLIFRWENGAFIYPTNFLQRLKRLMKYCGIEKSIRWHDLRHTNATLLLEGGANMKTVQNRLGHSLMQTTSDTYAHVTEKMNREATNIISGLLSIK